MACVHKPLSHHVTCPCVPCAGTPLRPAAVVKPATVSKAAPAGALVDTPVKAIGPIILNGQVAHSITQERLEIIRSKEMYDFLEKSVSGGCNLMF